MYHAENMHNPLQRLSPSVDGNEMSLYTMCFVKQIFARFTSNNLLVKHYHFIRKPMHVSDV